MTESVARLSPDQDPNTEHQVWSQWEIVVQTRRSVSKDVMKRNMRRLGKILSWQGKGRCKIVGPRLMGAPSIKCGYRYEIRVQVEGAPVQDQAYRRLAARRIGAFFGTGLGPKTETTVQVYLLSGETESGRPRAQLLAFA